MTCEFVNDIDKWNDVKADDLWVQDKLILARKLGYLCGPAGLPVPREAFYIVRPIMNFRMMSRGAEIMKLHPAYQEDVPDGYFWCEVFEGRHLSFDYHYGKQALGVEGFKHPTRIDRFTKWIKVEDTFMLPSCLQEVASRYEWFNVECIGDKVIECHFRYNDDFRNHNSDEIIPVWEDDLWQFRPPLDEHIFYRSPAGQRKGFWVRK